MNNIAKRSKLKNNTSKTNSISNDIKNKLTEIEIEFRKTYEGNDISQALKNILGNALEDILLEIIANRIKGKGIKVIKGSSLGNTKDENLSNVKLKIKKQLQIDYGKFGLHLPDSDLVVYKIKDCKVLLIISVKTSLRERTAQSAYWKLKQMNSNIDKNIKIFLVTKEKSLRKLKHSKNRAIIEKDLDGCYVICDDEIEETNKVKHIDNLLGDILKLIN